MPECIHGISTGGLLHAGVSMPRVAAAKLSTPSPMGFCDTPDVTSSITVPRSKTYGAGFGEGVCTCARCMRRAGPVREDVE